MDLNSPSWPPLRGVYSTDPTGPQTPPRTPGAQTPLRKSSAATMGQNFESPGNPVAPAKARKLHRNGYEVTPQTPLFRPFALNNTGATRQKAFDITNPTPLEPIPTLDPSEWKELALESHAIPTGANLHSFQVDISNLVVMCRGDSVVIASTGSGKSLSWVLPLLGISLVITPYTSLGLDGELSNDCDGISSLFIYSEQNTQEDFKTAATRDMLVIYVRPEMLESPSFARLLHSKSWSGRLSAIYIDEAHLIHLSHTWRPSYSRIYQLRNIVGHNVPLVCLSATCPELYRAALVTYAGLHSDYHLINLENFRPELSTVILPMMHDINTFLDLAFIFRPGSRESNLIKTIIYCEDLELLTAMFWWLFQRAASMGIPTRAVDIIHAGLSPRHQELCLEDFRNGATTILLGSSKISAGMNFKGVQRIIQYKVRDLSLPDADQRRGRGARGKGESVVMMLFVEPSMWKGGEISMENRGDQDPGMVQLIQSDDCAEAIIQRRLENPRHERHSSLDCCNRCDPTLHSEQEYRWIEVDPAPSTGPKSTKRSTGAQQEFIYNKLATW
ncbi:P-loop containing nucleoside triphosphate hydrolase protein [Mycena rosella]|uniref:DNA 3'-5' helicase n=1 Tax=Mycena rosella TaxID=1033263 RepID=A0AAD7GDR8_MYCRO|nr:P-loop containing nucleoside triphosphate hydrolase protein [Mycena rosella]